MVLLAEVKSSTFVINKMKIWLRLLLLLIYKMIFNFTRNEINFMNA